MSDRSIRRRLNRPPYTELENALEKISDDVQTDLNDRYNTFARVVLDVNQLASQLEFPSDFTDAMKDEYVRPRVTKFLNEMKSLYIASQIYNDVVDLGAVMSVLNVFQPSSSAPYVPDPVNAEDVKQLVDFWLSMRSADDDQQGIEDWADSMDDIYLDPFSEGNNIAKKEQLFSLFMRLCNLGLLTDEQKMYSLRGFFVLNAHAQLKRLMEYIASGRLPHGPTWLDVVRASMNYKWPVSMRPLVKTIVRDNMDYFNEAQAKQLRGSRNIADWNLLINLLISYDLKKNSDHNFHAFDLFKYIILPNENEWNNDVFVALYQRLLQNNYNRALVSAKVAEAKTFVEDQQLPLYARLLRSRPRNTISSFGQNINYPFILQVFTNRDEFERELRAAELIDCMPGFACLQGAVEEPGENKYTIIYPAMQPLELPASQELRLNVVWTMIRGVLAMRAKALRHGHLRHSVMVMPIDVEGGDTLFVSVIGNLGSVHPVIPGVSDVVPVRAPTTALEAVQDMRDAASVILQYLPDELAEAAPALNTVVSSTNPYSIFANFSRAVAVVLEMMRSKDDANFEHLSKTFNLNIADLARPSVANALFVLGAFLSSPKVRVEFLKSALDSSDPSTGGAVVRQQVEEMMRSIEFEEDAVQKGSRYPCFNIGEDDVVTGDDYNSMTERNMIFVVMPVGSEMRMYCMALTDDVIRMVRGSASRHGVVTMYVATHIVHITLDAFNAIVQAVEAADHVVKVTLMSAGESNYDVMSIE